MKRKNPAQAEVREEATIAAFLLYEDKPTGLRAKWVLDCAIEKLGFACRCLPRLWRLDLLNWNHRKKLAAKEAAEADLILISLHGNRDLPAATFDWLSLWLRRRRRLFQAVGILLDKAHFRKPLCEEILYGFNCLAYAKGLTVFRSFQDPHCEAKDPTQIARLRSGLRDQTTECVSLRIAQEAHLDF